MWGGGGFLYTLRSTSQNFQTCLTLPKHCEGSSSDSTVEVFLVGVRVVG